MENFKPWVLVYILNWLFGLQKMTQKKTKKQLNNNYQKNQTNRITNENQHKKNGKTSQNMCDSSMCKE